MMAEKLIELAILLNKEYVDKAVELLQQLEIARENVEAMKEFIKAGQWDDAWREYEVIAAEVVKNPVMTMTAWNPVMTAWVSKPVLEGYEKRAEYLGEPRPEIAGRVLEGREAPYPIDGVEAEKRIEEYLKPQKIDWEESLEEMLKPQKAEWEKTLEKYGVREDGK